MDQKLLVYMWTSAEVSEKYILGVIWPDWLGAIIRCVTDNTARRIHYDDKLGLSCANISPILGPFNTHVLHMAKWQ